MNNLMRALAVILILQATVLCYSLYIITTKETPNTIDCTSLVDIHGEE